MACIKSENQYVVFVKSRIVEKEKQNMKIRKSIFHHDGDKSPEQSGAKGFEKFIHPSGGPP